MLQFTEDYFQEEEREGFVVSSMMKPSVGSSACGFRRDWESMSETENSILGRLGYDARRCASSWVYSMG